MSVLTNQANSESVPVQIPPGPPATHPHGDLGVALKP